MSASAGRVLIIPKGIYDPTTTYHMLDMVKTNNGTYLCKKTSLGNAPSESEYWQLIIGNSNNTYNGTTSGWNSLSTEQKAQFETVIFTDD